MKPTDKTDKYVYVRRATEALAFLRQKVAKIEPSLRDSLSDLPEAEAKSVEEQLWNIVMYGEYYVEKVIADLGAQMWSVKGGNFYSAGKSDDGALAKSENFDFYYNKYPSFIKKVRGLINLSHMPTRMRVEIEIARMLHPGASEFEASGEEYARMPAVLQGDINRNMSAYEKLARNGWLSAHIKEIQCLEDLSSWSGTSDDAGFKRPLSFDHAFVVLYDLIKEKHLPDTYGCYVSDDADEHLAECNHHTALMSVFSNLLDKDYFAPGDWYENEKVLSPVIVAHPMKNIPTRIQDRAREILRSFVFGHWLSVFALSRCLLEYALIHRKSLFSKRLDKEVEMRGKKISQLTSIAAEAFPELKESMDLVTDYGNRVMHEGGEFIRSKSQAKKCIDEISKIISTLYSA
ncbi:MAG: hypothetical protein MPL62_12980 [Alphaproteobacteria bacterium]|nr:hypothetical protein [Alphaproteobacteria bacterium]